MHNILSISKADSLIMKIHMQVSGEYISSKVVMLSFLHFRFYVG